MATITITEALAEVKLIEKKIDKKRTNVLNNLCRFDHVKDPFEQDGGSTKVLNAEMQSIIDLTKRLQKIRSSIAKANLETQVTVCDETKSLHEWITWKREIAEKHKQFVSQIHSTLKSTIDKENRQPTAFKDDEKNQVRLATLITNVNYSDFIKEEEKLQDMLDTLDGKLSLKNATVLIDI